MKGCGELADAAGEATDEEVEDVDNRGGGWGDDVISVAVQQILYRVFPGSLIGILGYGYVGSLLIHITSP